MWQNTDKHNLNYITLIVNVKTRTLLMNLYVSFVRKMLINIMSIKYICSYNHFSIKICEKLIYP